MSGTQDPGDGATWGTPEPSPSQRPYQGPGQEPGREPDPAPPGPAPDPTRSPSAPAGSGPLAAPSGAPGLPAASGLPGSPGHSGASGPSSVTDPSDAPGPYGTPSPSAVPGSSYTSSAAGPSGASGHAHPSGAPGHGQHGWGHGAAGGPSGPGGPGAPSVGWGPPPEPGSPQHRPGDEFFGRIRELGAARPGEGRWVAGVASGLSRRLDIDQTLIRGTFVALSVVGCLGVALYGLCWLLLPRDDGRIHLQEAVRGRFQPGFFAAALMSLTAVVGGGPWSGDGVWFWGFPGTVIVAALIIGGVYWMAKRLPQPPVPSTGAAPGAASGAAPAGGRPYWTTPEGSQQIGENVARWGKQTGDAATAWAKDFKSDFGQRHRTAHEEVAWQRYEAQRAARARTAPSRLVRQLTLGGALLAASAVLTAEFYGDLPGWAGLTALGAAITVIACGVIANGLMGRRSPGLAGLGILLSLVLSLGVAAQQAGVDTTKHLATVGTATWSPATRDDAETQYNLGIGEARLNLDRPGVLAGATADDPLVVQANLGVGHLVLNLPSSVTVQVEARLGAGEVIEPDGDRYEVKGNSGNRDRTLVYGSGEPVVRIVAQQGVGQLEINQDTTTDASEGGN